MSNFKIGDRVRFLHTDYNNEPGDGWDIGCFGIVVEHVAGDAFNVVRSDRTIGNEFPYGYCFYADELELVEDKPVTTPEYSCIRVVPPSKPKREIVSNEVRFDCGASFDISDGGDNDVLIEVGRSFFTPKALREAAALFTTLAEVLEENSNA